MSTGISDQADNNNSYLGTSTTDNNNDSNNNNNNQQRQHVSNTTESNNNNNSEALLHHVPNGHTEAEADRIRLLKGSMTLDFSHHSNNNQNNNTSSSSGHHNTRSQGLNGRPSVIKRSPGNFPGQSMWTPTATPSAAPPLLDTCDVEKFQMSTPEVESMFINGNLQTPTPSAAVGNQTLVHNPAVPSVAFYQMQQPAVNGTRTPVLTNEEDEDEMDEDVHSSYDEDEQEEDDDTDSVDVKPLVITDSGSGTAAAATRNNTRRSGAKSGPMSSNDRVTKEQAEYAKGFELALEEVKRSNSVSSGCSGHVPDSKPMVTNAIHVVHPIGMQPVVPPLPPVMNMVNSVKGTRSRSAKGNSFQGSGNLNQRTAPINMADQEKAKLERKRARNRAAASKCRERKLIKIKSLEEKVRQIKDENHQLVLSCKAMKDQLMILKDNFNHHVKNGCSINTSVINNAMNVINSYPNHHNQPSVGANRNCGSTGPPSDTSSASNYDPNSA